MSDMIKFDGSDWNSVREMIKAINNANSMLMGRTVDDELIEYNLAEDNVLHTTVHQNNGWLRHTYYYLDSLTVEEMYKPSEEKKESVERANRYLVAKKKSSEEIMNFLKEKLETKYERFREMAREDDSVDLVWTTCASAISSLMYDLEDELGMTFNRGE